MEPTPEELQKKKAFNRLQPSWEACKAELMTFGYDGPRCDGWSKEDPPRVMPAKGCSGPQVWSAINPYAQWLARKTVLSQNDAYRALQRIAAHRASSDHEDLGVHVMVAGEKGTVCSWDAVHGGIRDMESILPGMKVYSFPAAWHSIHNSQQEAFLEVVEKLAKKETEKC